MTKILIVEEKHNDRYIDISTKELEDAAYLDIFYERKSGGYYSDMAGLDSVLFKHAVDGDARSAKKFLSIRSSQGYEYEILRIRELEKL
jgi:hypothetical protein